MDNENKNGGEITKRTLWARIRRKIRHTYGKTVITSYRRIVAQPFFMNLKNRRAKKAYALQKHELSDVQQKILSDLERDGLAFVHLDELFPGENVLPTLQTFVEKEFINASVGRNKKFLTFLWNNFPVFSLSNPIIKLALEPKIVEVANAYTGLFSRFAFFSVNRTIVSHDASAQGSQRWHRDPGMGDERMVKVFVYLNDVTDIGTGPFMFVKKTQRTGKWGKLFTAKQPDGVYPPDGAVESSELKESITPCFGRAGTLVFCDTTGLHKGGY